VGTLVTDRLRRVDQVAYVRFASVYKQFKTLEELVAEAKAVMEARHYEDPSQGVLWVEAVAAARNGAGASSAEADGNGSGKGADGEPASGRRGKGRGVAGGKAAKQAVVVPSQV
jgi:hypothetical protein